MRAARYIMAKNKKKKTRKGKPRWKKESCHPRGNSAVFSYGNATLFAGGFSRDAKIHPGMAVIDLAMMADERDIANIFPLNKEAEVAFKRTVKPERVATPVLNMYIPDYTAPTWSREVWTDLAADLMELMDKGQDVLVACMGGHGRTGMAVAILAGLMRPDIIGDDPLTWIRSVYCWECVETVEQERYIFEILEFEPPDYLVDKGTDLHIDQYQTAEQNYEDKFPMCQKCNGKGFDETDTGDWDVCQSCLGYGLAQ
jgi:hypothetical protein